MCKSDLGSNQTECSVSVYEAHGVSHMCELWVPVATAEDVSSPGSNVSCPYPMQGGHAVIMCSALLFVQGFCISRAS